MTITTDPATRLLARPFRPRRPGPDLRMGLSPGLLLTLAMNAAPDAFDPYQGYRPVPGGQIPHPRRPAIMQPRLRSAHRAPTRRRLRLDGVLDFAVTFRYRQHGHAFQPKHRRSTTVVPHLGPFLFVFSNTTNHEAPGPFPGQADNRVTRQLPRFSTKTRFSSVQRVYVVGEVVGGW